MPSSLQDIFVHFHHSCLKQTAYANNYVLYIRIIIKFVLQEWSFKSFASTTNIKIYFLTFLHLEVF
jgi:hypothetical protein